MKKHADKNVSSFGAKMRYALREQAAAKNIKGE